MKKKTKTNGIITVIKYALNHLGKDLRGLSNRTGGINQIEQYIVYISICSDWKLVIIIS